jgi:hypothetical protein
MVNEGQNKLQKLRFYKGGAGCSHDWSMLDSKNGVWCQRVESRVRWRNDHTWESRTRIQVSESEKGSALNLYGSATSTKHLENAEESKARSVDPYQLKVIQALRRWRRGGRMEEGQRVRTGLGVSAHAEFEPRWLLRLLKMDRKPTGGLAPTCRAGIKPVGHDLLCACVSSRHPCRVMSPNNEREGGRYG